jgi:Zn-dependent peptidase ImmA (M78 family)
MTKANLGNDSLAQRSAIYAECRALALTKRAEHDVQTGSLNIPSMQRIYKAEGIRIDRRQLRGNRIKAAYYCDDDECSVLLNVKLPSEPKLFALAHELKHHYLDQELIGSGELQCGDYNAHEIIEIAAEVFAADFIYPEVEMSQLIFDLGITSNTCTKEKVVDFKRACPARVSYIFIVKRFERFRLCARGAFANVRFKKLEEELFPPIYKQEWFKRARARKNK